MLYPDDEENEQEEGEQREENDGYGGRKKKKGKREKKKKRRRKEGRRKEGWRVVQCDRGRRGSAQCDESETHESREGKSKTGYDSLICSCVVGLSMAWVTDKKFHNWGCLCDVFDIIYYYFIKITKNKLRYD